MIRKTLRQMKQHHFEQNVTTTGLFHSDQALIQVCSIGTDHPTQELISPGRTTTRAKFVFEYLGVAIFLAVTDYNDDEIAVAELMKR